MAKITNKKVELACGCWYLHEDEDISTERLLEMCRGAADLDDVSDVIECLLIGGILKEQK